MSREHATTPTPAWKDEPDAPGLWIKRFWWSDTGEQYDNDRLFELVMTGEGLRFIGSRTHLCDLIKSDLVTERWFGPIPPQEFPNG